jgi:hypothetical protein
LRPGNGEQREDVWRPRSNESHEKTVMMIASANRHRDNARLDFDLQR